jgi:hypothetical protein
MIMFQLKRKLNQFYLKSSLNKLKFYTTTTKDTQPTVKVCKGRSDSYELGQPTNWTHPHLFPSNVNKSLQVTPYITKSEFEERRNSYVNHLTSYQKFYFTSKLSSSEKIKFMNEFMGAQSTGKANPNIESASINPNFIAIIPR